MSSVVELAARLGVGSASALRARPEGLIPVPAGWAGLFPDGGIRRGSTVAVGSLSVAAALLAAATQARRWCVVAGIGDLSPAAAAGAGVDLSRAAFVTVGVQETAAVGALMEGVDVVAIGKPGTLSAVASRQIAARARTLGTVVVGVGQWGGADVRVRVTAASWSGASAGGFGRLRSRRTSLRVEGRRIPRPRDVEVEWPLHA